MKECQSCGFHENPDDTQECINCGEYLTAHEAVSGAASSAEAPAVPPPSTPSSRTQHAFDTPPADSSGFLLSSEFDGNLREFDGQDILLNRGLVAPGNQSVSSERHARIFQQDGRWYIQDLSSNQATFVQVRDPMPLEDGTAIVIGQKIFTFQSK